MSFSFEQDSNPEDFQDYLHINSSAPHVSPLDCPVASPSEKLDYFDYRLSSLFQTAVEACRMLINVLIVDDDHKTFITYVSHILYSNDKAYGNFVKNPFQPWNPRTMRNHFVRSFKGSLASVEQDRNYHSKKMTSKYHKRKQILMAEVKKLVEDQNSSCEIVLQLTSHLARTQKTYFSAKVHGKRVEYEETHSFCKNHHFFKFWFPEFDFLNPEKKVADETAVSVSCGNIAKNSFSDVERQEEESQEMAPTANVASVSGGNIAENSFSDVERQEAVLADFQNNAKFFVNFNQDVNTPPPCTYKTMGVETHTRLQFLQSTMKCFQ
ncbi:hypothetical protein P9112_013759 [Eukaryota sp. TZLM1-RC]